MGKWSAERFIELHTEKHGEGAYDYSRVQFKSDRSKVEYVCSRCDQSVWGEPRHLTGCKCVRSGKLAFLDKARKVHGDRYEYNMETWKGNRIPMEAICSKHGVFSFLPECHVNYSSGCRECLIESEWYTVESLQDELDSTDTPGDWTVLEVRGRRTGKVKAQCRQCGRISNTRVARLLEETSCKCKNPRVTTEIFSERLRDLYGDLIVLKSEYIAAKAPVDLWCSTCEMQFTQEAQTATRGGGCKLCSASSGHQKVRKSLIDLGCEFQEEWKPDGGVFGNKLMSYDFLVGSKTIVEFDGQQHFWPVKHFGGIERFTLGAERDLIKTRWAIDNGYKILRIGYHEFESIPRILHSHFNISA